MWRWFRLLFVGFVQVVVVLVFALALVWQACIVGVREGPTSCLLLGVGGILTFFAVLAAHELGHVLAARAVGLPLLRFTVGLLLIEREGGQLRLRLNTAWFQPAAYVVLSFPDQGGSTYQWAVVLLGGPLASLLIAVACLLLASWLNPGPPHSAVGWRSVALLLPGNLATGLLNIAGLLSLWLGVGSLVPGTAAGFRTAGRQLLDLWRFHKAAQAIGCPVSAVLFILAALTELCNKRRQELGREAAHVSAREFCEYLLVSRGEETAAILRACNLPRSEDVGRVMFGLVNAGLAGRRKSDSEADFQGLFLLE